MAQATAARNYAGVWDGKLGFGRKTALLVIDLLQGYTLKGAPLFCQAAVAEALDLPAGWQPAFLVLLGYPADGSRPPRPAISTGDFLIER